MEGLPLTCTRAGVCGGSALFASAVTATQANIAQTQKPCRHLLQWQELPWLVTNAWFGGAPQTHKAKVAATAPNSASPTTVLPKAVQGPGARESIRTISGSPLNPGLHLISMTELPSSQVAPGLEALLNTAVKVAATAPVSKQQQDSQLLSEARELASIHVMASAPG